MLIDVPSSSTPLIQEMHIAAEHLFCSLVDYFMFENVKILAEYIEKEKSEDNP